jgi:colicin import membrane protein
MPSRSGSPLKTAGRWHSIALSVLLHGLIVASAVFGWFQWKRTPTPMETIAVEGTLVDERALKNISPPPKLDTPPPPVEQRPPEPEPVPVEEQGPPKPDPAELERKLDEKRRAQEKQEQQEQQEQDKAEQQKRDEAKKEKDALELKQREDAERAEAEKQAVAKAAADQAVAEKIAADKKSADKKRADDVAAAKKAAEEKARVAREAELRRSIEAEERSNAARNSDEAARWHAAIVARITRAWIRPPSARPGITCSVTVTQVPGGEVTGVHVDSCTGGDAALHDSVEAAVLRASPLPTPPADVPFERILELTFAPNE